MRSLPLLTSIIFLTSACGSDGGGTPPPPPTNSPPAFTSAQTATVTENATAAYQATASDPDGNALTYSISGGTDAAKFAITAGGALTFTAAPDFEVPGDADGNNIYNVQISVSDGTNSVSQIVNVSVINSREGIAVQFLRSAYREPTSVIARPGETGENLWVTEKNGGIFTWTPRGQDFTTNTVNGISRTGEDGLLNMVLLPDPANADQFLVYCVNSAGDIEIRRHVFNTGLGQGVIATFTIPHPGENNHNGGAMAFGPDGYLYVGVGDGGGAGDPNNNAQNPNSKLGKILRMEIVKDPYATATPVFFRPAPGNPYISGGGDPYVYALGFRNPWKASFHGSTLIIADVGQDQREEINMLTTTQPGANFGWPYMEGTSVYSGTPPSGLIPPVAEYSHGTGPRQGNSITGGIVYRGPIASLQGRYIFADFVSGNIWSVPVASFITGQTLSSARFERRNDDFRPNGASEGVMNQVVAIGEDSLGNLVIVNFDGNSWKIVPG